MVGRLSGQKGLDLVLESLDEIFLRAQILSSSAGAMKYFTGDYHLPQKSTKAGCM